MKGESMKKFVGILVGIIFLTVGIFMYFQNARLTKVCTEEATATVVDMKEDIETDEGTVRYIYYPIIEYKVNSKTVKSTMSSGSTTPSYSINDTLTILYNPNKNTEFIIKGDKVLMKDESMQYNVLLDPAQDLIVYYSELTNKGMSASYAKHAAQLGTYSKKGVYNDYFHEYVAPEVYRFEPSGNNLHYKDKELPIIDGRIETVLGWKDGEEMGSIVTTFELAEDTCYRLPRAYFVIFCYGLEQERLLVKYTWEQIIDFIMMGKLKAYACTELKEAIERPVSDDEFALPEGLKLEKERLQGTTLGVFWSNHCLYLKKHKIHPKQVNKNVIYDINEEWDF